MGFVFFRKNYFYIFAFTFCISAEGAALIDPEQVEGTGLLQKEKWRFKEDGELYWNFAGGVSEYSSWTIKHNGSLSYSHHTLENKLSYKSYSYKNPGAREKSKSLEATDLSVKYIFSFNKNWGVFYGVDTHLDHFAQRRKIINHDIGPRSFFSLSRTTYLLAETAFRYTFEEDSQRNRSISRSIRVYSELGNFLNKVTEIRLWAEFMQDLSDYGKQALSFEPSVAVYFAGPIYLRLSFLGYFHKPLTYEQDKAFSYYGVTSIGVRL